MGLIQYSRILALQAEGYHPMTVTQMTFVVLLQAKGHSTSNSCTANKTGARVTCSMDYLRSRGQSRQIQTDGDTILLRWPIAQPRSVPAAKKPEPAPGTLDHFNRDLDHLNRGLDHLTWRVQQGSTSAFRDHYGIHPDNLRRTALLINQTILHNSCSLRTSWRTPQSPESR